MKEKILIIDDDPNTVALLTLILQREGYVIFSSLESQAGLMTAEKETPDLILMDILMPVIDGFQICEALKKNTKTKEIPVIFLSALTEPQDKIKGLEIGGVDFVTKGGNKGELLARVRTQLKIRALTKELQETNAMLLEKQHKLDEDLKAAAFIQRTLLPHSATELPRTKIAWKFLPCDLVGGDIFNAIRIDEHHVAFYILDVSGHGVPSAMVSASVSEVINQYNNQVRAGHLQLLRPQQVLQALEREFPIERFDRYMTFVYLLIDVRTGRLTYSNAGHPPPLLMRKNSGKLELLDTGGPLIGLGNQMPFEEETLTIALGDKIILYTDGVTELQNKTGLFFGESHFHELLEMFKESSVKDLIERLYQKLEEFRGPTPPQDDISLLGIEFGQV